MDDDFNRPKADAFERELNRLLGLRQARLIMRGLAHMASQVMRIIKVLYTDQDYVHML